MSDEEIPKGDETKATLEQPAPGWKQADERYDPGSPAHDPGNDPATAVLGEAITKASHGWLRDRFRLDEDDRGQLHVPEPQRWPDLGTRAEQFVSGLMKGLVQKTPEEKEAAMGLRDPADVPRGTEVIGRLLSRFSNTVTDTWKEFVAEHATRENEEGKKVVDGEFVVRHGATLLGTFVSRLGEAFEGVGTPSGPELGPDFGETGRAAEPGPEAEAEGDAEVEAAADTGAAEAPDIKVDVDLGSIFRALFTPRS